MSLSMYGCETQQLVTFPAKASARRLIPTHMPLDDLDEALPYVFFKSPQFTLAPAL